MYQIRVSKNGGVIIEVNNKIIAFDVTSTPKVRPDLILISHAHRDHVNANVISRIRNIPIVMSRATHELLFGREKVHQSNIKIINEEESLEVAGIEIKALSAGHCVGSLQYFLNTNPSIVFTGDFNVQSRIVLRPAKILKGEVLIIDATYGVPSYNFPSRSKLYKTLLELIKLTLESRGVAYVAARYLGTSQEVTALVNLSTLRVPVLVDRRIYFVNKVHEKYEGEELRYGPLEATDCWNCVKIISLRKANRQKQQCPIITCTGWAALWKDLMSLPLSSHSDFDGLIKYVKESGAELVIPAYGFIKEFCDYLSEVLGITCLLPSKGNLRTESI